MNIERPIYLQKLKDRMHDGMIKVITGLRRSGKSYLLFELFRRDLLDSGIRPDHIIGLELDMRRNEKYRDPDVLLSYLSEKMKDDGMYYILLDEVQMLKDFVSVLNARPLSVGDAARKRMAPRPEASPPQYRHS